MMGLSSKKALKKGMACVLTGVMVLGSASAVPMQGGMVQAAGITVYSMTATQGPVLTADSTGGVGFTYPVFNGNSSIAYSAVADDLSLYVKGVNSSNWVCIDGNAGSGWVYNQNYGQFWDGPGGYWFTLTESINVKLQSKSTGVSLVYTLNYGNQQQSNTNTGAYALSAFESNTTYTADSNGAVAFVLPKVGGKDASGSDVEKFVYEVKINGNWVDLEDYSKSTFVYSSSGYNNTSEKNQWGHWYDYVQGLWFQPIQQNYEMRIGYPQNGVKDGAINNNYVYYTLIGNPNAYRPTLPEGDYVIGDINNTQLEGWELVFNDEFTGNKLDTDRWNYVTGYYINDDPGTWGWGNQELEYYTDSEKNVYVQNGNLNITAYSEPKTFPQDTSRVAPYSSGKITTQDKFAFKYGRIDFRAKLPEGNGLWPALWLLPNDDTYGTWAASGEIDVMEARGRIPGVSTGAIHYGGTWPDNKHLDGAYTFENGGSFTDYHTYSVIWEEGLIKWYVDGNLFHYATGDQWYTTATNKSSAPFDQEFYVIMNLAVGGWFDNGVTPSAGDIPATMQVDYVRVYKAEGDTKSTASGSALNGGNSGSSTTNPSTVAVTGISLDKQNITLTNAGETTNILKTIAPSNATNKNVTWTSSNEAVAKVSAGQITAVGNGTAVITATTQDGNYKATCTVKVEISENSNTGSGSSDKVGDDAKGLVQNGNTLEFYVNNASFADLHYKVNNGGQLNVAMVNQSDGNFKYTVNGVNAGDKVEYFFTYNPGNGALDTAWASYTVK